VPAQELDGGRGVPTQSFDAFEAIGGALVPAIASPISMEERPDRICINE
jgi:hypothetical protein